MQPAASGHAICPEGRRVARADTGAPMETPACVAAVTFQGRAEERDDDLEHLPPLLEDEVGTEE